MTGNGFERGSYYLPYKKEQVFEKEIGTFVLFYKAWHSSLLPVDGARKVADGVRLMWEQTILVRGE
jgi:hypothetical protein